MARDAERTGRLRVAEAESLLKAIRADPGHFLPQLLFIKRKDLSIVPFHTNASQDEIVAAINTQKATEALVREIVLKERQIGVSTLIQGLMFLMAMASPGSRGITLTHEKKVSQKILSMAHLFITKMPKWIGLRATATMNKVNLHCLECVDGDLPIEAEIYVDTATGKVVAHGDTVHFVQASEYAYWPDAARVLGGLLQAVPRLPGTMVVIESTANGVGNDFHERWLKAESGTGEFKPLFLEWFRFPEYSIVPPKEFEPNEDEKQLTKVYGLTPDQLWWRRQKIETDYPTTPWRFNESYPMSPTDAFLMPGQPAFDQQVLSEYRHLAKDAPKRDGELVNSKLFVPKHNGILRVFEAPKKDAEYMIGVDTALGVTDGDDSAGGVIDRGTQRFVAEFLGKVDPRLLAHFLNKLGHFYNTAIVAIEINNHGRSTQNELVEHLRYPKPYRWRRYDNMSRIWTDKMGWETSWNSRPMLVDDMAFGLTQRLIGLPSTRAIDQLLTFDATGARTAVDDLAMAYMIAWHCHMHTPMKNGRMPRTVIEKPVEIGEGMVATDIASRREWENVKREIQHGRQQLRQQPMIADVSDTDSPGNEKDPWPEIQW